MSKSNDLLALAETDLKVAKLVLNSSNDELMQNTAAYHTEQAVEKALKSILSAKNIEAGVTHNIQTLCDELDAAKIYCPEWIKDKAYDISSWATTIRYNTNFKADHDEILEIINGADELIAQEKQKNNC